jgi:uncharacterized protein (DUF2147 family)
MFDTLSYHNRCRAGSVQRIDKRAEPIVGNRKTAVGPTATIGPCGGGYCITLKTGKHGGERIGAFNGKDGHCSG